MKVILKYFLLITFLTGFVSAQNLDSLYNELLYLHDKETKQADIPGIKGIKPEGNRKCGFGLVNEIKRNLDNFSSEQQSVLKVLLNRPEMQTSMVTPSGNVRIHYDTTGNNKPDYKLRENQTETPPLSEIMDSLAAAVDYAYNIEINELGYPEPPSDNGNGGDNLYDIYVLNLGSGYYGYTELENQLGNNTYTCFTVIDNDYSGSNYASRGLDGAKVTVAHEFHHGIQIGNYIYRSEDRFYYEITSTAMEEFVYDEINDYYSYMNNYFKEPERRFARFTAGNDGYDLAIWNIFLKERYDFDVLKRVWELMREKKAVVALSDALNERGSNLKFEYNKFGVWSYFTGSRAKPEQYFEEGANYPQVSPMTTLQYQPPQKSLQITTNPISNNYLMFVDDSRGYSDTLTSVVTNCDINGEVMYSGGELNNVPTIDVQYTLSSSSLSGSVEIIEGYYSKVESSSDQNYLISEMNIFNNVETTENINLENTDYAYPQPFQYHSNSFNNYVNIPAPKAEQQYVDLFVYSVSMDLVYSKRKNINRMGGKVFVSWDGMDSDGEKLPSGVYIYVTKSDQDTKKGKLVIQNE